MKLSAAVEKAIVTRKYNMHDEYMCCVLKDMHLNEHVINVQYMVAKIAKGHGMLGQPLSCALHNNKDIDFDLNAMSWREIFQYTKQLYCWWVFDLKRKGL